jgi:hypothetical protein
MKVEAEPYETGAVGGRALIILAFKRTIVLELCVLVRAGFFIRE